MRRGASHQYSGCSVYIFNDDANTMKKHHTTTWTLLGLWTHSNSPVVQYICDETDSVLKTRAESLGIEKVGVCVPAADRHRNYGGSRQVVIYNHGNKLEGDGNYTINILQGESPFITLLARAAPWKPRDNQPMRRYQGHEHARDVSQPRVRENAAPTQWYTSDKGNEKVRKMKESCLRAFSPRASVEMSRDPSTHNLQLTIEHQRKRFLVNFPHNFPKQPAHLSYTDAFTYNAVPRSCQITKEQDIVRKIQKYCKCHACKGRTYGTYC